jgi:uncharacterized metal-binding protein YceD (DUF177 family)
MMIIDVRKLNAQKKYVGTMQFEYSASDDMIEIPLVTFNSPVSVCFDYEIFEDDSVEIRGTISYKLKGQCSRCLKETQAEISGELDAYFQPVKDSEDYSYSNGIVDLTQAVNDAIMLSMPYLLACEEECQALTYSDN